MWTPATPSGLEPHLMYVCEQWFGAGGAERGMHGILGFFVCIGSTSVVKALAEWHLGHYVGHSL